MSRAARRLAILLCPLALTLFSLDASAQGKKTSKDAGARAFGKKKPGGKRDPKMEEAKRLFDQGAESYDTGNYEKAIELWEMSYDLSKADLILANIANAYERLGQPKKAHEYLSKWRAVAPEEEHETLDARLKNLDERVAREEQEAKEREEKKRREQEQKERERLEAERRAKEAKTPVLGIVLAGAGVAMVAGGVVLDLVAVNKRPDEATACRRVGEQQVCGADSRDAIKSSNTLAYVGDALWITGAVAAAVGGVLIVTSLVSSEPKADAAALTIAPVAGPTGAGLFVGARF